MGMKDVFKRYLVFVIGLYFLAAGIVLIVRSALGTTPISSVNYVLSLNSPLSLGTCTFLINIDVYKRQVVKVYMTCTGYNVQFFGLSSQSVGIFTKFA